MEREFIHLAVINWGIYIRGQEGCLRKPRLGDDSLATFD